MRPRQKESEQAPGGGLACRKSPHLPLQRVGGGWGGLGQNVRVQGGRLEQTLTSESSHDHGSR